MKKKNFFCSLLTVMLVTLFCMSFSSCSSDDDDDLGQSESQMREYLESGSGIWLVSELEDGDSFSIIFKDGKTNGFEHTTSAYWLTPYSIKGDLVYIKDEDANEYHGDVLEGGIRITKLTASKIEFYWANDPTEKYAGIKQDY